MQDNVKIIIADGAKELEFYINTIGYDNILQILQGTQPSVVTGKLQTVMYTVIYRGK